MSSSDLPPWRKAAMRSSAKPPTPVVPAKRPAEGLTRDETAKRSTVEAQEKAWVAEEGRFALQQAKKRAALRVKGGRASPIDWLAVALRVIDPDRNPLDDEIDDAELDMVDPQGVLEGLDDSQLAELENDIDKKFIPLETNKNNQDYWNNIKLICKDRRERSSGVQRRARGAQSVSTDVDQLLGAKSFEQLGVLEKQVRGKLNSNEPVDSDYWEDLMRNILVYKAKASLRKVSDAIVTSRVQKARKHQSEEASALRDKLKESLEGAFKPSNKTISEPSLDPEPLLKLRQEDKVLESIAESEFLENIREERRKILKLGYIPARQKAVEKQAPSTKLAAATPSGTGVSRFSSAKDDDFSQAATALYEREVARGVNENEEIFAGEEEVTTINKSLWANKYRPRKPRYFNRVQMGYEWNKYNQTHYDHDNPPPKVVQGYKFNIFYPDLMDKTKAPTYKIEREHGRKRGQSFAPAGEEDTCIIRFIAGPPYEDIAFRIVDKEWDYSAKRERGFKSSFDKGILQLHFQFKKIYYRK